MTSPYHDVRRGSQVTRSRPGGDPDTARNVPGRPRQRALTGTGAPSGRAGTPDRVAEVRRGSTLNLFGSAISGVATLAVTVVITREFPKAIAGAFFTAIAVFYIVASIATLGTNIGLTYFIARLRSLGEERVIPSIQRIAIIPVVLVSLATAALMILLADPLAHLVLKGHAGTTGVTPADVAQALRALAIMIPFSALLNAYLGASRGYGDMRPSVMIGQVGLTISRVVGILAAVVLGAAALLAPLWALPNLPAALIAWLWGRRIGRNRARQREYPVDVPPEVAALLALSTPVTPVHRRRAGGSAASGSRTKRRQLATANARGFWLFTTPRAIANTAQNILQQIDIVLVAIILGPAEAAIYTAATRFLVLGQLGNQAISRASQARFTELFTLGDRRGANVIYRVTTVWVILLLWPLYLLAVVYGPAALQVFGHSYTAGGTVIVILGLAALVGSACGQVDMVLITSGRSSWSLANGLLAVGVNIAVDLVLIPRYGITGAAIGWAAAILVSNLVPLIQLAATLQLSPFGRNTAISCTLSVLSFGVIPLAVRAALGDGVVSLLIAALAGCAFQATGLWRFRRTLGLPAMPGLRRLSPAARAAAVR